MQQPLTPAVAEKKSIGTVWFGAALSHTSNAQSFSGTLPLAAFFSLAAFGSLRHLLKVAFLLILLLIAILIVECDNPTSGLTEYHSN